jgi:hypothetical protein
MVIEQTASQETYDHYMRPEIMETILRVSNMGEASRWLIGDSNGWYRYSRGKKVGCAVNARNYKDIIEIKRTLHYTLSMFEPALYGVDFNQFEGANNDAKVLSRKYVKSYTFGIDIDTVDEVNGHGVNIRDPAAKEAVEAMATYFANKLREHTPNSVYACFSGGGIYILVHHGVFQKYLDSRMSEPDYAGTVSNLTDALNVYIDTLSEDFFAEFPQYKPYVKADSINNAKRNFKTIFSIHKRHPFAVIPLDVNNIKIDFNNATLPIPDWVIEFGQFWYDEYDTDGKFMVFLTQYLNEVKEIKLKQMQRATAANGGVQLSNTHFDMSAYPPCVQNILAMQGCGVGASRALGFLAAFLGQVGTTYEEAVQIWSDVATRWGISGLHIFESWYQKMNCPCCLTLSQQGAGYPHIDIASINACQPDMKCLKVCRSSPVYYVNKLQYAAKLRRELLA